MVPLSPTRVLIVDDSALVREVLSALLARDPLIDVVGTARDGATALAAVERLKPDVVTLDVEMPGMSGLEVLERLRGTGVAVIIIASSVDSSCAMTVQALALGAFDFVPKPTGAGITAVATELVGKVKAAGVRGRRARMRSAPPVDRARASALPAPRTAPPPDRQRASALPAPRTAPPPDRQRASALPAPRTAPPPTRAAPVPARPAPIPARPAPIPARPAPIPARPASRVASVAPPPAHWGGGTRSAASAAPPPRPAPAVASAPPPARPAPSTATPARPALTLTSNPTAPEPRAPARVERPARSATACSSQLPAPRTTPAGDIIAIGSSTGGPQALEVVLAAMPADSPPILVVQHMPANFTAKFAQRLDGLLAVRVKEAEDGDRLRRGLVLLAPGSLKHMVLRREGHDLVVRLLDEAPVGHHRPSVDVLFRSCAAVVGRRAVGAILTGMGADGARGLLSMRQAGSVTIAQNEATCVVYGMPMEAVSLGAAAHVLPLDQIGPAIARLVKPGALRAG